MSKGQPFELGIAEMYLFRLLSGLGLSHRLFGEHLIPIGTLYDPFVTDADLYRHEDVDARGIAGAALALAPERPIRNLRAV